MKTIALGVFSRTRAARRPGARCGPAPSGGHKRLVDWSSCQRSKGRQPRERPHNRALRVSLPRLFTSCDPRPPAPPCATRISTRAADRGTRAARDRIALAPRGSPAGDSHDVVRRSRERPSAVSHVRRALQVPMTDMGSREEWGEAKRRCCLSFAATR